MSVLRFYRAEERAFAPGIVTEWPKVWRMPRKVPNGRLVAVTVPQVIAELQASGHLYPSWQPMETADRSSYALNRRVLGIVNGEVRVIAYGFSSHTKWLTWCLADQGVENFDSCTPTAWMPLPLPAATEVA